MRSWGIGLLFLLGAAVVAALTFAGQVNVLAAYPLLVVLFGVLVAVSTDLLKSSACS